MFRRLGRRRRCENICGFEISALPLSSVGKVACHVLCRVCEPRINLTNHDLVGCERDLAKSWRIRYASPDTVTRAQGYEPN